MGIKCSSLSVSLQTIILTYKKTKTEQTKTQKPIKKTKNPPSKDRTPPQHVKLSPRSWSSPSATAWKQIWCFGNHHPDDRERVDVLCIDSYWLSNPFREFTSSQLEKARQRKLIYSFTAFFTFFSTICLPLIKHIRHFHSELTALYEDEPAGLSSSISSLAHKVSCVQQIFFLSFLSEGGPTMGCGNSPSCFNSAFRNYDIKGCAGRVLLKFSLHTWIEILESSQSNQVAYWNNKTQQVMSTLTCLLNLWQTSPARHSHSGLMPTPGSLQGPGGF